MAVFVINLARAPDRWAACQRRIPPRLPPDLAALGLERVEAVDGAALDLADPAVPLSARARQRLREPWRLCNAGQLDSPGALGSTLSHTRCWDRLLADPDCPWALVLEDDCCLEPAFAPTWTAEIRPRLDAGALDWAVLGHYAVRTWNVMPREWVGAHCYVVARAGAARLRAAVFPAQLHVDHWLNARLTLGDDAPPRALVWPTTLATQCDGASGAGAINHWHHGMGYKRVFPEGPGYLLGLLLAVLGPLLLVLLTATLAR